MNLYQKKSKLGIVKHCRPMTVNRGVCVSCLLFHRTPHHHPLPYNVPPPLNPMKYVQGKQRWGWCADLAPLWLTATRPVPLLIHKACRVSAGVASLASLHAIRALSSHPCLHFNHHERSDNKKKKKGSPISYSVQSTGETVITVKPLRNSSCTSRWPALVIIQDYWRRLVEYLFNGSPRWL